MRTSSGVTYLMSAWIIWPTLSSTDIFASSALTLASSAGSGGNGQWPCGHDAGWTVAAVSAASTK